MIDKFLVVIDCQNDFIKGSLACKNADNAIDNIIKYINKYPDMKVFYTKDYHNNTHCSFIENGGTWPKHCIVNTEGVELDKRFFTDIINNNQKPNKDNTFLKGTKDDVEEYSAFHAKNDSGIELHKLTGRWNIYICGIATEFCVKETINDYLDIVDANIVVLKDGLGYVNKEEHSKVLKELDKELVKIEHIV